MSSSESERRAVFMGEFHHRINAKNQMAIPRRLRKVIPKEEQEKGLYLVQSSPECVYLYTHTQVVERIELASALMTPAKRRQLTRRIHPVEMDTQGRILMPAKVKEAAGIKDDVTFIGNADRIEIWASERLERLDADADAGDEPQVEQIMYDIFER